METRTPESSPESFQEKDQLPLYLQDAEGMRKAIGLENQETEEGWNNIIERFTEEPPRPDASPVWKTQHANLREKYEALDALRQAAAKAMGAVYGAWIQKIEMDEDTRTSTLQRLALFLEARHQYQEIWEGKGILSRPDLPPYLAPLVDITASEALVLHTVDTILPLQYTVRKNAQLDGSPEEYTPAASRIALRAMQRGLRMNAVLPCFDPATRELRTDDAPYIAFLAQAGMQEPSPKQVGAAKLLIGFLGKHQERIQRITGASEEETFGKLYIADALDACTGIKALSSLVQNIALAGADVLDEGLSGILEETKNIYTQAEIVSERSLSRLMTPFLEGEPDFQNLSEEEKQGDILAITQLFLSTKANVALVHEASDLLASLKSPRQRRVAERFLAYATSLDMKRKLRSSLFIELEDHGKFATRVDEELTQLLDKGEISVREAIDLFVTNELGGSIIPLALRTLIIIRERNTGLSMELEARMVRQLAELALRPGKIEQLVERLGLLGHEDDLQDAVQYLGHRGLKSAAEWWERWWAYALENPEISVPLAAGASYLGWIRIERARLAKFAGLSASKLAARYPGIPLGRLQEGQKIVTKILTQSLLDKERIFIPRWLARGKARREGMLIFRAATDEEISKMVGVLLKRYPQSNELITALASLGENPDALSRALKANNISEERRKSILHDVEHQQSLQKPPPGPDGGPGPQPPEGPSKPPDSDGPKGGEPGGDEKPKPKPSDESGSIKAGESADDAARQTEKAVEAGAETADDTTVLLRELREAERLGKKDEMTALLGKLEKVSAAGDKKAQGFLKLVERAKAAEIAGYTFVGLGFALDLYFIWENEEALKVEKNEAKKQVLLAKRESLKGEAGTGLLLNGLSGFSVAIAGPLYIAETVYSDHVYRTILEHEMTRKEWRNLDIRDLREKMRNMPIGYTDAEHTWAHGRSLPEHVWYRLVTPHAKQEQDAKSNLAKVEKMNAMFRGEILEGYMLKTCALPRLLGEDDEKYRERESLALLDAVQYFHAITKGSNYTAGLGPPFFEQAQDFMELSAMQRSGIDGTKLNLPPDALRRGPRDPQVQEALVHYRSVVKPVIALHALQYSRDIMRAANTPDDEIDRRTSIAVHTMILHDLVHRIVAADALIDQEVTWNARDRVRFTVRSKLEGIVQDASQEALRDSLIPDLYQRFIRDAQTLLAQAHTHTEVPTDVPNHPSEMHQDMNRRLLLDLVEKL